MDKRFWILFRISGWIILLGWYCIYMISIISPIFTNRIVFLSHGVTGITGTVIILIGYLQLEKQIIETHKKLDAQNSQTQKKS